jgi:hypothetical protein
MNETLPDKESTFRQGEHRDRASAATARPLKLLSVRWFYTAKEMSESPRKDNHNWIMSAQFWDGHSYGHNGENLFCSTRCGYYYGRAIARKVRENGSATVVPR